MLKQLYETLDTLVNMLQDQQKFLEEFKRNQAKSARKRSKKKKIATTAVTATAATSTAKQNTSSWITKWF